MPRIRTEAQKNKDRKQPSKRWCVTDWEIPEDPNTWKDNFPATLYFAVWQVEKCPKTDKPHIQGFLKFEKSVRMAALKKCFNDGIHCEHTDTSDEQNINYCSKEDTRLFGPYRYGENKDERQRTDLLRPYEMIKAGADMYDVMEDNPTVFCRFHRAFEKMQALHHSKRFQKYRQVEVTVFWGPTRSGKTRRCMEEDPNLYKMDCVDGQTWFDGYNTQNTILFDDFYGQIRAHDMLKYLDGHMCRLPVKGSHAYAGWTRVFITSNVHPDEWYSSGAVPEGIRKAIRARIKNIFELKAPAGGDASAATPTDTAAPQVRGWNPLLE